MWCRSFHDKGVPVPGKLLFAIANDVIKGLQHMHARGYVHAE